MPATPYESDDDTAPSKKPNRKPQKIKPTRLRIVAGELRSRRIEYNGDPGTRPMKEKTREAVFSLLGGYLYDTYAIDLFAGTGILGFEAISRGAVGATLLELSRPTVSTMLSNMKLLNLGDRCDIQNVDTFRWMRTAETQTMRLPRLPWILFCCPPYALWKQQAERMIEGLVNLMACAPDGTRLVCETEDTFTISDLLPQFEWDIRRYKPASVGIGTRPREVTADVSE
jgi:16S rRNA (guanine966-N2)-methyltransferase